MKSQNWEPLKKGDIVDVIAPAGKPKPGTLEGVKDFLESWGLEPRVAKNLVQRDLLCANNRENRFQNLKQALLAKDSKMIWCLRGGYGSLQLLEDLKKVKPQAAKCFVGFSDITSLHAFLNQSWGWSTVHGCNIDRFALGQASRSETRRMHDVVFGIKKQLSHTLVPLNDPAKKNAVIKGNIVGGNLITLQSSFGTGFEIQTKNKILFLEETGERAYKVDRVLEHMRQLGLLKKLRAIVLGQFTDALEPNGKNIFKKYFANFAARQNIPILMGLPVGHGKNQHPLPFNTNTELYLGSKPKIVISTGARSID